MTYQRSLCTCFDSTFISFCGVLNKVFVHRKPQEGDSVHWCVKSSVCLRVVGSERVFLLLTEFSSCFLSSQLDLFLNSWVNMRVTEAAQTAWKPSFVDWMSWRVCCLGQQLSESWSCSFEGVSDGNVSPCEGDTSSEQKQLCSPVWMSLAYFWKLFKSEKSNVSFSVFSDWKHLQVCLSELKLSKTGDFISMNPNSSNGALLLYTQRFVFSCWINGTHGTARASPWGCLPVTKTSFACTLAIHLGGEELKEREGVVTSASSVSNYSISASLGWSLRGAWMNWKRRLSWFSCAVRLQLLAAWREEDGWKLVPDSYLSPGPALSRVAVFRRCAGAVRRVIW